MWPGELRNRGNLTFGTITNSLARACALGGGRSWLPARRRSIPTEPAGHADQQLGPSGPREATWRYVTVTDDMLLLIRLATLALQQARILSS